MVDQRTASKCLVVFLLLCVFGTYIECGRSGGGGRSGGSRGSSGSRSSGWGGSRSSSSSSWGWGSGRGSSSGAFSGSSSSRSHGTGSSSSHVIGSSPGYGSGSSINLGVSSGKVSKPNTHSTSHVLPISTGSRTAQQPHSNVHVTPLHSPSAPSMSTGGNHAPAAPPLPTGNNKPAPAPGWNVGNDGNIRREQTHGLNNPHYPNQPVAGMYPPPYTSNPNQPGAGMHPPPYSSVPNQPGAGMHPPPYPGSPNHYPNAPPPPYHGASNNYPGPPLTGVPPPPYPGTSHLPGGHYSSGTQHYPGGAQNYPGMGGHYPTQHGAHMNPSYYQSPQYYPQPNSLPPPPPGYSPYGVPYYQKPNSGIKASHVMMGLALWQMTKPHHHHHFYGSGYDTYNNPGYGYHEFNRQRYTTTYSSQNPSPNAPGAHNTLEMTQYVIPDKEGEYKTVVGNMTCMSLYDAKAVSKWANRTMEDFYRKFPGSEFPLFETGKNTTNKFENFTMETGRIIHEETISVTCCGTDKGPLELTMLTSGKSPDVNCLHFVGKIPFRKITFIKTHYVSAVNVSMDDWKPIELVEPNLNSTSTPTPLAPFPTTLNTTDTSSSTTPSVDLTQTYAPLGVNNNISTSSTLQEIKNENSTFPSLGSINSTTVTD